MTARPAKAVSSTPAPAKLIHDIREMIEATRTAVATTWCRFLLYELQAPQSHKASQRI